MDTARFEILLGEMVVMVADNRAKQFQALLDNLTDETDCAATMSWMLDQAVSNLQFVAITALSRGCK